METKRCGICTSVIEQYPCPLCGYNGELEEPAPKRRNLVPEEELEMEQPKKAPPKKKTKKKKRKKRGSSLLKWLLALLLIAVLALAGVIVLKVHIWESATCTAPETCRICRKTRGEPLPHSWVGDCVTPGKCVVCGAVQEEAPGHSWRRTDCLTAGVCSVCGEPEPEAPGHDWMAADCETPETCSRCGAVSGSPLGHVMDGQNAVCSRCGKELSPEQQAESLLASQSHSIFENLFAAKDWQAIYNAAKLADTPFEGAAEFAAYMSARAEGEPELWELPRENGAAPGYEVRMGEKKLAQFTLRKNSSGNGWEMDSMELFLERPVTATVQTPSGCVVTVNGVKLEDSYIISRTDSPAAEFLPEGTPGLQNCTWQVKDLLAEPKIGVLDAQGEALAVARDEKTGVYHIQSGDSELSEDEEKVVFAALESYSGFMINAAGARSNVMKYFENGTQTCKNILLMGGELWMNKDRGHKFREETVLNFQRYDEDLFAVRASLIMETNLSYGGTRDYTVTETMFFANRNNKWVCFAMTNQDVLTPQAPKLVSAQADEWEDAPDGIRIEACSGPNFNAHIMLVRDPSRVYLGLSNYTGFSLRTAGKRLTEAIRDEEAVAAVNAGAFYDDGTSDICVGSTPAGLTIYEGKLVSNVYTGLVPEKGFCGLDGQNRLVVAESMTEAEAADLDIRYGCEFGPVLIQDGKINQEAYAKEGYNPRTAVGQREDGTLIFVCADGRQAGSLGATYGELIDILVEYGAVNACNMDGGSSTVMLTRDDDDNVSFVNSYSVLQSEPRRMPTFWLVRP